MVFYFSGTGNSKFVAKTLAEGLDLSLESIPDFMGMPEKGRGVTVKEEPLGFVFPIHAWGPPQMVLDFIETLDFSHVTIPYCFAVATCGEDCGKALEVLRVALAFKGVPLHSAYSLTMPNNYIIDYRIDSEERVSQLIEDAKISMEGFLADIRAKKSPVVAVTEGAFPRVKTKLIHPLFKRFGINPKGFLALDTCTACGLCEKACMTANITMSEAELTVKPKWGKNCTFCLACINICPVEAIQYGSKSEGNGRYFFK